MSDSSEIDVAQLAHEVRALRRLVLAILVMALVFLTILNVRAFLGVPKYEAVFADMLGSHPLPKGTQITLRIGSSTAALMILTLAPIASMVWLWLERKRPALPVFVMLCLCVMMMLFLVWTQLTLSFPMQDITSGIGGF